MPSLFSDLIKKKWECTVFPIREYWLDVGRREDFEKGGRDHVKGFDQSQNDFKYLGILD